MHIDSLYATYHYQNFSNISKAEPLVLMVKELYFKVIKNLTVKNLVTPKVIVSVTSSNEKVI